MAKDGNLGHLFERGYINTVAFSGDIFHVLCALNYRVDFPWHLDCVAFPVYLAKSNKNKN